jgi:cysteine desulfurase
MAHSSIRFGIGRFSTEEEVDLVINTNRCSYAKRSFHKFILLFVYEQTLNLLEKHVARLREMSPLWEMVQEGIDLKTIEWTQDASHSHHH